ncbi:MAG: 8-oxo-dGTP diphosphatase MutT [Woeseiaceae bacterium]|nr:8-oxo-dGTP diphosphatase MutT [Woeseiaceae bacterium]MDX2608799.1 8-oxo-dGTP diphosphatase MutT [Woeseiaceae bacterium]
MKQLHVAAGILRDSSGRILITERLCDGPFNGLWEFPGGKIAHGETSLQALIRELAEELGIEVATSEPFMELHHEYPDRIVDIEFFVVTSWSGTPAGLEGQGLRWVLPSDLDPDILLPADVPVLEALQA